MRTNKKTEEILEKVLRVIKIYLDEKGYPPSIRELKSEINVNSTSTIHYYLDKLEEKGLIKRTNNKNRAIEVVKNYYEIRKHIHDLCEKYNIKAIIAHNMRFDYRSTTTTQRYISYSKYRFFFPYDVELWDTLKMAQDTICKQKTYIRFCEENGYTKKNGSPRATAEILYRYISGNNDFIESHTGLEDVLIEKEIFAKCMAQHKKMRKNVWE